MPAINAKFLPPAADDLSTSVFDHRKNIVEMVELDQNLGSSLESTALTTGNEGLLRSQCKSTTFRNWIMFLGLHTINRIELSNNHLRFFIVCVLKRAKGYLREVIYMKCFIY